MSDPSREADANADDATSVGCLSDDDSSVVYLGTEQGEPPGDSDDDDDDDDDNNANDNTANNRHAPRRPGDHGSTNRSSNDDDDDDCCIVRVVPSPFCRPIFANGLMPLTKSQKKRIRNRVRRRRKELEAEEIRRKELEEEQRQRKEELKAEERQKKQLVEEDKRRKQLEDEERQRKQLEAEEDKRKQREAEEDKRKQRQAEEDKRKQRQAEEDKRKHLEAEEDKRKQRQAEEEKRKQRQAVEEKRKQRQAEEEKRKHLEAEEEKRKHLEAEEEKRKQRQAEEEKRKHLEAEEEKRKHLEAEEEKRKQRQAEEEIRKQRQAEEEKRKHLEAEEEKRKQRQAEEEKRKHLEAEEEKRNHLEAEEEKRKHLEAEEEKRKQRQAEEEKRKHLEAEEEKRKHLEAEEEKRKQRQAEEENRKQRQAEEENRKQRQAEEENRKHLEAEEEKRKHLEAEEEKRKQRRAEEGKRKQRQAEDNRRNQLEAHESNQLDEQQQEEDLGNSDVPVQESDTTPNASTRPVMTAPIYNNHSTAVRARGVLPRKRKLFEGNTIIDLSIDNHCTFQKPVFGSWNNNQLPQSSFLHDDDGEEYMPTSQINVQLPLQQLEGGTRPDVEELDDGIDDENQQEDHTSEDEDSCSSSSENEDENEDKSEQCSDDTSYSSDPDWDYDDSKNEPLIGRRTKTPRELAAERFRKHFLAMPNGQRPSNTAELPNDKQPTRRREVSESDSSFDIMTRPATKYQIMSKIMRRFNKQSSSKTNLGCSQTSSPMALEKFIQSWEMAAQSCRFRSTSEIDQAVKGCKPRGKKSKMGNHWTDNVQYGRVLPHATDRLLRTILNIQPSDVFVDIGHGIGNAVLQAAYTIGCESRGIEVVEERHAFSCYFQEEIAKTVGMPSSSDGKLCDVTLKRGRLEAPEFQDFLTYSGSHVIKAFCNNFNEVFGSRSVQNPGQVTLDDCVAGLFASMKEGSKLATFYPLTLPVGPLDRVNKERRLQHGLEPSNVASFYTLETVVLGPQNECVSWSKGHGIVSDVRVYVYTRVGPSCFLCSARDCPKAKHSVVQAACNIPGGDDNNDDHNHNDHKQLLVQSCPCNQTMRPQRIRIGRKSSQPSANRSPLSNAGSDAEQGTSTSGRPKKRRRKTKTRDMPK
ncbi:hypothetical protein ACA910_014670 [Epithemia clementina (nom. ined.)]